MADALADLGELVHDRTLVLNILRGLNERFQFMSQFITRQKSFPSFADVRADLRLAELNMAPPSPLVVSSSSKPPASQPASGSATPRPQQNAGGACLAVAVAVAGVAVAAVAKEARPAASQAVPSGPPSSIRGQGPSTCGPGQLPAALAVHLPVLDHLHRHRCSSMLWWPACLQPSTLRLRGRTTRRPPRHPLLPGRQHHLRCLLLGHHGISSPSPTPSAPSPSPRLRTPRTG